MNEITPVVSIEDISPVKKRMSCAIPWAAVREEMDDLYREIAKTAKVKGFRPGKVPKYILEGLYRKAVEEEAAHNLMERYYREVVREHTLKPLGIDDMVPGRIVAGEPFSFSATFEVEPVVEPKDYVGMELEKPDETVTDADVEERLAAIRDMYATIEEVEEDRPVENGDFVMIDFQGFREGKADERMKGEDYLLEIGSRNFVPAFEDALVGARRGETREFDVTFPEDYHHTTMAGKEIHFQVAIKALKVKKLPPLDEEFVKNFDNFDTVEELRNDVRRRLEEERRTYALNQLRDQINAKLLAANEFPVPDMMVEIQKKSMMDDFRRRMERQGRPVGAINAYLENAHEDFRREAERFVRIFYLMRAIAEKEAISVDDGEVEKHIETLARQRGQDPATLYEQSDKQGVLEALRFNFR
ncbi:MAG: trigger factor [Syntrophales bacterium]|nr:trigger factor [Syntrophales bacterium]